MQKKFVNSVWISLENMHYKNLIIIIYYYLRVDIPMQQHLKFCVLKTVTRRNTTIQLYYIKNNDVKICFFLLDWILKLPIWL